MPCLFCSIASGTIPSQTVYETETVKAFLDITPTNPGHVLVIPKSHAENLFDAPAELMRPVFEAVHFLAPIVRNAAKAEGVNIVMNNGAAAGQMVFHPHIHIIPRKQGDGLEGWHGHERSAGDLAKDAEAIRALLAGK